MPETADVNAKLDAFKAQRKQDAEQLVLHVFPERVLELNALVSSDKFAVSRIPEVTAVDINIPRPSALVTTTAENNVPKKRQKLDTTVDGALEGTKVMGFVTGSVPYNSMLDELVNDIKPILLAAVEDVNKVKLWILLQIPRMEDGNNFGVSIQEEVLSEVRTVEAEAAGFLDQVSRYFLTRGKLVEKLAKFPHVEDYRHGIRDLDEKEFINLRLVLLEMRNHYATLHDLITKNLEKIKKPRTNNMHSLY